jgi:hypothetical protein
LPAHRTASLVSRTQAAARRRAKRLDAAPGDRAGQHLEHREVCRLVPVARDARGGALHELLAAQERDRGQQESIILHASGCTGDRGLCGCLRAHGRVPEADETGPGGSVGARASLGARGAPEGGSSQPCDECRRFSAGSFRPKNARTAATVRESTEVIWIASKGPGAGSRNGLVTLRRSEAEANRGSGGPLEDGDIIPHDTPRLAAMAPPGEPDASTAPSGPSARRASPACLPPM